MNVMPRWSRLALGATVALLVACGLALTRFREAEGHEVAPGLGGSAAVLRDFEFTDQRGKALNKAALSGHVWIADFIFTTCTSACPLITSRLVTVQRRLLDERLRFVSFSVDPERDTESELARYAARWAPQESRWHLLHTDARGLGSVLSGLHVGLDRADGEIAHTRRLFLIDARGDVAGDYDSGDDAALDALVLRTRQLLGVPSASAPLSGTSGDLFVSLGCAGCHGNPQLAPPLSGLAGSHVMLERAGSVLVDDDYLRQSIIDPGAQLVAGYPNSMPSYGPLLSAAQVQSLIGYMRALPAQSAASASEGAAAQTDPVCGMPVRVTPQTPNATYQGKTYHFCSPACAQRFTTNPQKYPSGNRATLP
jgi:protein SCO1/2